MQYMLLIYEDERIWEDEKSETTLDETIAKHMALAEQLGAQLISGAGLKNSTTATTVRIREGCATIHDGPFAETKEQLGGFYLVDVADLDAALAIAKQIPLAADGSIEIRPVLDSDGGNGA